MKEIKKIVPYLIFLYLAFFPLGQIIRFDVSLLGRNVPINITDIIAFLSLVAFFVFKYKEPPLMNQFKNFALVSIFSLLFSLTFFKAQETVLGSLYLLRLLSYFGLYALTWNIVRKNEISKEWLFTALFIIVSIVSILGWLQYFVLPDMRDLSVWGWDDHLYRLVGSFLDPTFTGIILVFGFLVGVALFLKERKLVTLVLLSIILSAIAYTYSRASYIALAVGVIYFGILVKKVRLALLILLLFSALLVFLPRPGSEGVVLERTKSIVARFESYKEGIEIFKKSPVFGIGLNNICLAKTKFLGTENKDSHSCSGLDSSLLFILVTTGIIGILVFLDLAMQLYRTIDKNIYGYTFKAVLVSLLIHSFFSNSIFYPWVLGFASILAAVSLRSILQS